MCVRKFQLGHKNFVDNSVETTIQTHSDAFFMNRFDTTDETFRGIFSLTSEEEAALRQN